MAHWWYVQLLALGRGSCWRCWRFVEGHSIEEENCPELSKLLPRLQVPLLSVRLPTLDANHEGSLTRIVPAAGNLEQILRECKQDTSCLHSLSKGNPPFRTQARPEACRIDKWRGTGSSERKFEDFRASGLWARFRVQE